MNGIHNESGNAGLGANGEDLNVVLGRFQTWAATRAKVQPPTPTVKARPEKSAVTNGGKLGGDAREISYDQALRASRYRRPVSFPSPDPPQEPATRSARVREMDETVLADKASAYAATHWNEGEDLDIKPWEHRWPEVRFTKPGPATATTERHPAKTAAVPAAPQAASTATSLAKESAAPGAAAAKKTPGTKRTVPSASAIQSPLSVSSVSAAVKAEPSPAAVSPRRQRRQPVFSEVMKGTAALAAASTGSTSLANGKSTTLTLRVSDGEQARIQACAAQANLSVSAYLRQCALGVDELRGQVQIALAEVRKEQGRPIQPPGLAAIPGILRRFGMRCLQRFHRSRDEYTAVSIR